MVLWFLWGWRLLPLRLYGSRSMAFKLFLNFLLVGIGGALGSACRYGSGLLFAPAGGLIPWGTLLANLLGSLIIGFVVELASLKAGMAPEWRLFLATGFCGGLTTLSSMVFEVDNLGRNREFMFAMAYGLGTLIGAFLALWAGMLLCRLLLDRN